MFQIEDFKVRRPVGGHGAGTLTSPPRVPEGGLGFATSGSPWTLPVETFSATSLAMLYMCPRQWQQRYIHHRKEAPGAAKILGSANHAAHGFNWNCKALTGSDVPLSSVIEFYDDSAWPKALDDVGGEGEVKWDTDAEAARDLGRKMVEVYHENVSPLLMPEKVEKEISFTITGVPVPIIGYVDLVQQDDRPIVDLKTSKSRVSKIKGGWRLQGLIYQIAERKPLDWHVVTKNKTPSTVTPLQEPGLAQEFNPYGLANALGMIREMAWYANHLWQRLGPDQDWPTLGYSHDWRCDWCGYKTDCPAWRVA